MQSTVFRTFVGTLLLSICLVACQPKESGKVLPPRKMVAVLTDVYLTDAMLQHLDRKTRTDWSKGLKEHHFQDVSYWWLLEKHHISEQDFFSSVSYYGKRNKEMVKLHEQVEQRIKQLQNEVARIDSLQKAAEAQRLFDLKWQTVEIDTSFVMLWMNFLSSTSVDTMAVSDSTKQPWLVMDSIVPMPPYDDFWRLCDSLLHQSTLYYQQLCDRYRLPIDTIQAALDSLPSTELRTDDGRGNGNIQ